MDWRDLLLRRWVCGEVVAAGDHSVISNVYTCTNLDHIYFALAYIRVLYSSSRAKS